MSRRPAMRTALASNVYVLPAGESATRLQKVAAKPPIAPAQKPRFAPDPQRRVMIAKIQIARKDLDFDDGDYRALLTRITGLASSTAMSVKQLAAVLDEFARLGWVARPSKGKALRRPAPADHPAAKKARAMLISLGLLGVIRNTSEGALEAFARRQLGTERLQWADQAQVYKLIEALKAIAVRHGWDQSTTGLAAPIWTLKLRLCEAILKRLHAAGVVPPETGLAGIAAIKLGATGTAIELTERDLEQLAAYMGGELARHAAHSDCDD